MTDSIDRLRSALSQSYRIERVLGAGGMATVYLAVDLKHERRVAIKVLRPEIAAALGEERFLREIRITAGLDHPHILTVIDSGEADGLLYYVMPFMEGESLRDRLRREKQLPINDALAIARGVAGAVAFAHSRSIIHRDIKPENILFEAGQPVVADFGIARAIDAAGAGPLTATGLALGTPGYMSPEQAVGAQDLDARSDVYSLGCLLYEMLVGEPPYTGPTPQVIIARAMSGAVPRASATRETVPPSIDRVIAVALAKTRADRYATAAEFLTALSSVDGPHVTDDTPVRAAPIRVRPVLVVALLTAGIAAAAAVVIRTRDSDSPASAVASDNARVAVLPLENLSGDSALDVVANGLTTDLIDELAQYPALTVISKNGVMPFRGVAARTDSIARVLNVGNVVTGDVRRAGDSVKVVVRLIDGASSIQHAKADASGSMRDLLTVRSDIIDSVTSFLRKVIGAKITANQSSRATNAEAWELLARAKSMMAGELTRAGSFTPSQRAAKFAAADTLLARAAELDRRWAAPVVTRGGLLMFRADIEDFAAPTRSAAAPGDAPDAGALRRQAVLFADQALSRSTDDADALYLRGRARLALWRTARPIAPDSLRAAAEADLRRVVARRRDMAQAWNDLSSLLQMTGDYAEAGRAADEALKADAFLMNAGAVVGRLLFISLATGRSAEARDWCERGRRRYPRDPRFWGCDLLILGWTGKARVDVGLGWRLLEASEARDSANVLLSGWGTRRLLVAAIAARAGLGDSARAIMTRVRAGLPGGAPADQLDYGEAHVHTLLGHPELAIPLLDRFVRANPALRGQVRNTPWFKALRSDSRFLAITAPQ